MMSPAVTIGIPTYCRPRFLVQAVQSALKQTGIPVQVVVHDNDPNSDLETLLKDQSSSVDYVRHMRNLGAVANFHSVALAAETEFFAWLQDDDVLFPDFVQTCLGALQDNPEAVAVMGFSLKLRSLNRIDRQRSALFGPPGATNWCTGEPYVLPQYGVIPWAVVRYVGFSPTVLFRASALVQSLPKDPERYGVFWERVVIASISSRGPIVIVPRILGILRIHGASASDELCRQAIVDRGTSYRRTWTEACHALERLMPKDTTALEQYFRKELRQESHPAQREYIAQIAGSSLPVARTVRTWIERELPAAVAGQFKFSARLKTKFQTGLRDLSPPLLWRMGRRFLKR